MIEPTMNKAFSTGFDLPRYDPKDGFRNSITCYCGMLIDRINLGEKMTCSKCFYGDWVRIAEWNVVRQKN